MTVIDKLRNYWQAEQFDSGWVVQLRRPPRYLCPGWPKQYRGTQSIIAFWRLDFGRPR